MVRMKCQETWISLMVVHWLGFDMVVGSNLGRYELSFLKTNDGGEGWE